MPILITNIFKQNHLLHTTIPNPYQLKEERGTSENDNPTYI